MELVLPILWKSWSGASYAILGLRMWFGRRWRVVTQTSQCEVLKPFLYLCSRMDANQHKPTFSMYLLHFPACLMTCKESARHLEAGDSLDSRFTKEGRKEKETTYVFDRIEMTAPNCELNFVLRTAIKEKKLNNIICFQPVLIYCAVS